MLHIKNIYFVAIVPVISFIGLAVIATNFDPYTASVLIKSLFFTTLIITVAGIIAIIITLLKRFKKDPIQDFS